MKRDPSLPPILELDATSQAVIEPSLYHLPIEIPEHCVLCFFQDVIDGLAAAGRLRLVKKIRTEIGKHPVYELEDGDRKVTLAHPGVGAPLAASLLEILIASGCRKFMVCGGAGSIRPGVALGEAVVLSSAVRDEGTSYHYLPASREVEASPEAVAALRTAIEARGLPYVVAKTWTTDAIFRETRDKIAARREEGCAVVEMEAAALFAVARFRGVTIGQVVYAGDDVSGEQHEHRHWDKPGEIRQRLFAVAVEACLGL